jgi:1,4-dihydroxy-2-naphthoate octaprenyltransferase
VSGTGTDKTAFHRALRPFSLIVALATCGLGVSLAWLDGARDPWLAMLVLFNGLLLQIAVNLINDHRDIDNGAYDVRQQSAIRRNTRIGYAVMLLAVLIGLYMVSLRGWPLLLLGLVGVLGAWGYTGGQINYKSRGLGILLVFLLMGVLLIGGAYYVVTGDYSLRVFWLSLPFSLLSSLLLLSNELRDYEADLAEGIRTLSVRLGYDFGVRLYYGLSAAIYLVSVLLYQAGLLQGLWLLLVTAIALWQPFRLLRSPPGMRQRLTPLTGRLYLLFSLAFIGSLWGALP